jgi:hypothetical protein
MTFAISAKKDPLPWLLEEDSPGVRYLALRDLLDLAQDEPELHAARTAAYTQGPIASILSEMAAEGYWVQPGSGYNPKYRSTVWSLIMLAQLGARIEEDTGGKSPGTPFGREYLARACAYLIDQALNPGGQFSTLGSPSGTVDCLQGNLCWALTELGSDDPRLEAAFEWMARSVTGEGIAPSSDQKAPVRYYAGKCGPDFACGANNKLPCAWGAVKVMLAFGNLPPQRRTPLIKRAIERGEAFLLGTDPASADYPTGWSNKPSGNWWKFGFPVFYVTDILQILEALVKLGYAQDPRLENALALILDKQDDQGRWPLEYDYRGKTWVDFGPKKQPNKLVTLRALRVLKAVQ